MINPKEASKYMDNLEFLHEIENASDENISSCYQCYKCSIGCPVAAEMDVLPHRIIPVSYTHLTLPTIYSV